MRAARQGARPVLAPPRALVWWYGLMAAGGVCFGLVSPRRPFGDDVLLHPLVVFAGLVAAALIGVRIVQARPVPEVIPERALVIGIAIGVVAFLAGNFAVVHLLGGRLP
ncbi:MAG: hypothetical protein EPO23_11970 [Xanthobacteraceae bacterium]|nr:MAG: hypothetical protein EPO23_11970 [Xanthobacteraceae bacterium]